MFQLFDWKETRSLSNSDCIHFFPEKTIIVNSLVLNKNSNKTTGSFEVEKMLSHWLNHLYYKCSEFQSSQTASPSYVGIAGPFGHTWFTYVPWLHSRIKTKLVWLLLGSSILYSSMWALCYQAVLNKVPNYAWNFQQLCSNYAAVSQKEKYHVKSTITVLS